MEITVFWNVTGIVDEATGKENSKWMCSIDVSAIDSSGSMEVEIPLRLSRDENEECYFTGAGGELVIPTTVEYNEIMKNVKKFRLRRCGSLWRQKRNTEI